MPAEKNISILGLKGAGKSTFLAVLNLALATEQSSWRIRPVGRTIGVMATLLDHLFSKGLYPDATGFEQEMEFFVEKDATMLGLQPGALFRLRTADVPGEAVRGVSSVDSVYHGFYERYLKGCSGIIFLLDYKEKWREKAVSESENADVYFPLFSSILAEIREQNDINPYVVFCLTKVDMLDGQGPNSTFDKTGYFDSVEQVAGKILGRNTKALIDQTFDADRVLWLPVSATGFTGTGPKRQTQCVEKRDSTGGLIFGIRNPQDLKPIGVAESLEWILNNLAGDDEDVRIARTRGKQYADVVKNVRKLLGF